MPAIPASAAAIPHQSMAVPLASTPAPSHPGQAGLVNEGLDPRVIEGTLVEPHPAGASTAQPVPAPRLGGVGANEPPVSESFAEAAVSAPPIGAPADAASSAPGPVEPLPEIADFQPANEVEENLLAAAGGGSTDSFLSTLLLARVLMTVSPLSDPGSRPGDEGFVWQTEKLDGETYVVVYTSPERVADHGGGSTETVEVKFVRIIRNWPDESWSFAVNPGTPVGAKLPGSQIVALANWAAELGLGDDSGDVPEAEPAVPEVEPHTSYRPEAEDSSRPTIMQKVLVPTQLSYYLERGYDRVSGFVHRAAEVVHLSTPAKLYKALGLNHSGSPFSPHAEEIHLVRWPAYRPNLYRIPYGGQNEAAMRAMEGWVIERPPFRGNGFAPGESSDVIAEFKVDSARLPHGAEIWRVGADGTQTVVAILDADTSTWRRVDGQ